MHQNLNRGRSTLALQIFHKMTYSTLMSLL